MNAAKAWTFVTNHALVLNYISKHPRSTAREIAQAIGVTERTAHKIISDLDAEGYIRRMREGRRNVYSVDTELPMRHDTQRDVAVGELLRILAPRPRRAQRQRRLAVPL